MTLGAIPLSGIAKWPRQASAPQTPHKPAAAWVAGHCHAEIELDVGQVQPTTLGSQSPECDEPGRHARAGCPCHFEVEEPG